MATTFKNTKSQLSDMTMKYGKNILLEIRDQRLTQGTPGIINKLTVNHHLIATMTFPALPTGLGNRAAIYEVAGKFHGRRPESNIITDKV